MKRARINLVVKIPSSEKVMLFYYFTMPIWRDHFFAFVPGGWLLCPVFLWCLIFFTLLKQPKNLTQYIDIITVYFVIFFLFLFKFWGNSDMSEWVTRTYGVLSVLTWGGIYSYAVIRLQKNIKDILNVLKKTGIFLGIYYAWRSLEVLQNGYWTYTQFDVVRQTTSNMSWSYGVLMALCFLAIYLLVEKKKWVIPPICLGIVGILVYGSRGTLIAFLIGVVFVILLYNNGKMTLKNYFILFLGVGLGLFFLSDAGLTIIANALENAGLSSRFIESLLEFNLDNNIESTLNGRWAIWMTVIEMIKDGPFYGYGVFGERNAVYGIGMKWGYSHNIFLELLVSFGWLIGGLIIILMVACLIRFFIKVKDKNEKLLFIIFLTISFELLLSNTIWLHCAPWALMGLYVNHFKKKYYDMVAPKQNG